MARLVFITQISAHACIREEKKRILEGGGEKKRGLLFVCVSLLIDASHKTSTIRDHSSSFLPLLTSAPPPPNSFFIHPQPCSNSFLPSSSSSFVFSARWRHHTGFHAAACHFSFDPGARRGGSSSLISYKSPPLPKKDLLDLSIAAHFVWILDCPRRESRVSWQ